MRVQALAGGEYYSVFNMDEAAPSVRYELYRRAQNCLIAGRRLVEEHAERMQMLSRLLERRFRESLTAKGGLERTVRELSAQYGLRGVDPQIEMLIATTYSLSGLQMS